MAALSIRTLLTSPSRERLVHAAIGLVAGIALYGVYLLAKGTPGPTPGPEALGLGVVFAALLVLMTLRAEGARAVVIFSIIVGAILGLQNYYLLSLFNGAGGGGSGNAFFSPIRTQAGLAFDAASIIIAYITLAFFQAWQDTSDGGFSYERLFCNAWTNALLVGVAILFTLAVWAVLGLWAGLFGLINLTFFKNIFTSASFVYIFTGTTFGLSIALAKEHDRVILALRGLALTLCRFLAPILAVASILFLLAVPFTGLAPLWKTGAATPILLSVCMGGILFVNAVVQYGQEDNEFPIWARYLLGVQMLLMPALVALAYYSTSLRIGQHGLTPQRVYAMLLIAVVGIHALAYAWSALRYRLAWGGGIIRYNPILARIAVVLALLVHLPLIDPYHLSARDQFSRLAHGDIKVADFDFGAMKFHFGDPGREMLARMETDQTLPFRVAINEKLALLQQADSYYQWMRDKRAAERAVDVDADLDRYFFAHPDKTSLPDGLLQFINQTQGAMITTCGRDGSVRCALVAVDADQDKQADYLFVRLTKPWVQASLFFKGSGDNWHLYGLGNQRLDEDQTAALVKALTEGKYELAAPRFKDIRFGDTLFGLGPAADLSGRNRMNRFRVRPFN